MMMMKEEVENLACSFHASSFLFDKVPAVGRASILHGTLKTLDFCTK